jgi:ribonuclease BN (tRNA processing enzyme)
MSGAGEGLTRRGFVAGAAAVSLAATLGQAAAAQAQRPRTRLILLGTKGGPTPSATRVGASSLLMVGNRPYVIDCADGVARQLVRAGVDLATIRDVFITHHHSDHNVDLGALILLAWGSGLKTPVHIYGPPPLSRIMKSHLDAYRYDIEARIDEEGRPPLAPLVKTHEFTVPRRLIDTPELRVTCALVDHYRVKPAFAYRFDTADRSIVFSGDTTYSPGLIALAKGADILVHEAMYVDAIRQIVDANAPDLLDHLLKSHTTTEQLGLVAQRAGVRTVVLSHLVPAFPSISDEMWAEGVRKHFKGEVLIGRDLMEI